MRASEPVITPETSSRRKNALQGHGEQVSARLSVCGRATPPGIGGRDLRVDPEQDVDLLGPLLMAHDVARVGLERS